MDAVSTIEADKAMLRWLQAQIRTSLPAIVTAYNPATNRANVKLVRKSRTPDGRTFGPQEVVDLPVEWPHGGGWALRWEMAKGDECSIRVMDRSFQEWIVTGQVADPQWTWMHALSDSIVVPGMRSAAHPFPGGDGKLYLGREDGTALITIDKAGGVVLHGAVSQLLGQGAADFLIKGTSLSTALTPIISTLTAVPAAVDPATVITLANANKAAILAALAAIQGNLSTRTATV